MAIQLGGGTSLGTPTLPFLNALTPVTIAPAQCLTIPPGPHLIQPGLGYAQFEAYDSQEGFWKPALQSKEEAFQIDSDGSNYRIINRTGCPTGALITNTGSSYTNGIGVVAATVSAGGSKFVVVTGGSINTSVTVTTAGSYAYVPTITFSNPPPGGVRASGYVTLSASTISSVTVTNAGAGYTSAPTITITPDPRETLAGGGVLTVNATLANSGKITAILCTDPGTAAQTSTPTLTFSAGTGPGGGGAATTLMNYTVTGFTVTTQGSSYGTSNAFLMTTGAYQSTATVASGITDPQLDVNIASFRQAWLLGYSNSSGNVIASNTSLTTIDAGWGFQQTPSLYIIPPISSTGAPTIGAVVAATVGGTNDTWFIQRLGV